MKNFRYAATAAVALTSMMVGMSHLPFATAASADSQESEQAKAESMWWVGTISKPEFTAYQYGTHVLEGHVLDGSPDGRQSTRFALKSRTIKLSRWMDKRVIITGHLVAGYPVDFGPALIEVTAIEPDQIFTVGPEIDTRAEAMNNLSRKEWRLSSFTDSDGNISAKNKKATARFNRDGSVLFEFCNTINGRFGLTQIDKIDFTDLKRTKKGCRGGLASAERFIREESYDYDITKGYLTIENGSSSMIFTRSSTKNENPMAN